jgi:hypothetical protein
MASNMIRAILPFHLRTRAHVGSEVTLEVADLKPRPGHAALGAGGPLSNLGARSGSRLHSQKAVDALCQLRIDLVGNQHDVRQYQSEIYGAQVALDGLEDAHLQDSRLLHD